MATVLSVGDVIEVHFAGPDDEEYRHEGSFAYQDDEWLCYVRGGQGYLMQKSRILYVVTTKEKVHV